MGLDQYIYAEKYYSEYTCDTDQKREDWNKIVEIADAVEYVEPFFQSATVRIKVAQWRKANQVHGWFVNNCQNGEDDCRDAYVELEQLQELKNLCEQVLASPSDAQDLLPATSGFFFGSDDYDDYYFDQLKETIKIVQKLEKMSGDSKSLPCWSFIYSSSW